MDTCIQSGYCQEALNILSHTKSMTKKYGRTVPIVRMVGLQAQEISGQLFSQLCKKLSEPITLPVCLKVGDVYKNCFLMTGFMYSRWLYTCDSSKLLLNRNYA